MPEYNYNGYNQSSFGKFLTEIGEVGFVESYEHPIIGVSGLPGATLKEVVLFELGGIGQIMSLNEEGIKVMALSARRPSIKERVVRTGLPIKLGVDTDLLGKAIDCLGNSLYPQPEILTPQDYRPIDKTPPGIDRRVKINQFFETGVSVVDMMIPLGKGQRELIIGNRKTGKTEFLLQTMLNQARKNTVCVYCCVGKPALDIKKVEIFIHEHNIQANCVLIASYASDPASLVYLTPFSAMTLAEFFLESGRDVLLILDDLTDHAKYYRELALLARKFPGRSAYPADIFYTHSRLLERAGYFKTEKGVNAITCLPVAETVQGDITGYIQTNLMSITDGHIYFDEELFL